MPHPLQRRLLEPVSIHPPIRGGAILHLEAPCNNSCRHSAEIVDVHQSALETIELAASWAPAALLLDVQMPHMDGYSLVREIRRIPAMATAHILAVTAYTAAADRERAFAAGIDAHIAKPINGEVLVALIAKLVAKASRLEDSGAYIIP